LGYGDAVNLDVVKNVAAALLYPTGVTEFTRPRQRGQVAILMYHGIAPEPLSPRCWHVVGAAMFRQQMEYLAEHFNVLPLEEALERMYSGTLPDRAATITFDDGTRNLATHAAPILRSLGLPGAVFLATDAMANGRPLWPDQLWLALARTTRSAVDLSAIGLGEQSLRGDAERGRAFPLVVNRLKDLVDEERIDRFNSLLEMLGVDDTDPGPFSMLSWDEARGLAADGTITLHPHSVTHPILSRCTDDKVEREISESCAELERETGCAPKVFAYPNGRAQDFDERAKKVLGRHDVRWALSTVGGFADRHSDPLAVQRLPIGSNMSTERFRLLVSGALPWRRGVAAA
jgi:peptidoglycan/xylan/chitin deacetylase (PgdA/CDA1 family)